MITNFHVVANATAIEVRLQSGEQYSVTAVKAVDRNRDLVVLQMPGFRLPFVSLADSDQVAPGDKLIVIGTPLGVLENTVTTGVVSGIRNLDGNRFIQMDAAVSPGNSGGPVANEHGEVIGVTVAKIIGGENLNLAIPINAARGYTLMATQNPLSTLSQDSDGNLFADSRPQIPHKWRSLTSGTIKAIRVSEDAMYVETELPADVAKGGGKIYGEFKKRGETWVGVMHSELPCTYYSAWDLDYRQNWCPAESPSEIKLLSPTKIEGWSLDADSSATFNCKKCTWNKPVKKIEFTWIPE